MAAKVQGRGVERAEPKKEATRKTQLVRTLREMLSVLSLADPQAEQLALFAYANKTTRPLLVGISPSWFYNKTYRTAFTWLSVAISGDTGASRRAKHLLKLAGWGTVKEATVKEVPVIAERLRMLALRRAMVGRLDELRALVVDGPLPQALDALKGLVADAERELGGVKRGSGKDT